MIGPLPTPVAIVLAILTFLVVGLGAFILSLRKDFREAKQQPIVDESQRLANIKLTEEIAAALREGQRQALAEYRTLMETARTEAAHAREDAARSRADAQAAWEQAERARLEAEHAKTEATEANRLAADARAEAANLREAFKARLSKIEGLLRQHAIAIPEWWHDPI